MNRFRSWALVPFLLLTLAAAAGCGAGAAPATPTSAPAKAASQPTASKTQPQQGGNPVAKQYSAPPQMAIDANKSYTATLHTSKGDILVDLFPKDAPNTVNNFVFLAKDGFYDNVRFHRIIKGFMVQTGDPKGDGTGGPGYRFKDEPVTRKYDRGIVAMANCRPQHQRLPVLHHALQLRPAPELHHLRAGDRQEEPGRAGRHRHLPGYREPRRRGLRSQRGHPHHQRGNRGEVDRG